jgi:(p)ppGpp synthase/HD superfamily hydrolase
MIYVSDNKRHLVCYPYSITELHKMAKLFYIKPCWFHKNHYDIPEYKLEEIRDKTFVVSSKVIVRIIRGEHPFSLIEKAEGYALTCHGITNHFYDEDVPYSFHLHQVGLVCMRFIHLIPEVDKEIVIAACWLHDTIEDTRKNWNDLKRVVNELAANYSYALTNEKGKFRSDRANDEYYKQIKYYKHSLFIKLCDRIANVFYAKSKGSSMYQKYQKEAADFYNHLYDGRYQEMWDYLNNILNETNTENNTRV